MTMLSHLVRKYQQACSDQAKLRTITEKNKKEMKIMSGIQDINRKVASEKTLKNCRMIQANSDLRLRKIVT